MDERAELEERIEAYLDGGLEPAAAAAVEAELSRPEAAAALREALALRSILQRSLPDEPPAGLCARLEAALGVEARRAPERGAASGRGAARAAWDGARWAFRGPTAGIAAGPAADPSAGRLAWRGATAGLGTLRYALGPWAFRREPEAPAVPRRATGWRRWLGLGAAG